MSKHLPRHWQAEWILTPSFSSHPTTGLFLRSFYRDGSSCQGGPAMATEKPPLPSWSLWGGYVQQHIKGIRIHFWKAVLVIKISVIALRRVFVPWQCNSPNKCDLCECMGENVHDGRDITLPSVSHLYPFCLAQSSPVHSNLSLCLLWNLAFSIIPSVCIFNFFSLAFSSLYFPIFTYLHKYVKITPNLKKQNIQL